MYINDIILFIFYFFLKVGVSNRTFLSVVISDTEESLKRYDMLADLLSGNINANPPKKMWFKEDLKRKNLEHCKEFSTII